MGEKETATDAEAERLKNKTKSNQSNDRLDAEDDDGDEASVVKTKTKSNQSNDRLDVDDDGDDAALEKAGEEKKKDAERIAGGGGAGGPEAAINNTKSNIKNLSAPDGGIEHHDDWDGDSRIAVGDIDDADEDIAIDEEGHQRYSSGKPRQAYQGFRAASGGGAQDPTPSLAINEEGVAEDKPRPKNK